MSTIIPLSIKSFDKLSAHIHLEEGEERPAPKLNTKTQRLSQLSGTGDHYLAFQTVHKCPLER